MKEIKRYTLINHDIRAFEHECGELVRFTDYEKLQTRIKELESDKHINEIKAQGVEEAVTKADSETYIGLPNQCFPPQKQYKAELLRYAEQLRANHETRD